MDKDCVFCKIIEGEIPSFTVYEDGYFKAILDRYPSGKGHTVIIPKKHFKNIFEIDEEYSSKVIGFVKKVTEILDKNLKADGYNILQNNGEASGQTVFHYHIHVIPRYKDDNINIKWHQMDISIEDLEKSYNDIME